MAISDRPEASDSPSSTDKVEDVNRKVGEFVRLVRVARGMSLKAVSEGTGLSTGYLSQIERGQSSASIKSLRALAHLLDVEIEDFFSDHGYGASLRSGLASRLADRVQVEIGGEGAVQEWVTPPSAGAGLDLSIIRLDPDAEADRPAQENQGVEAGFVLEGGLELRLGDQTYLLGTGDSFTFRSQQSHRIRNAGGRQAAIFWASHVSELPPPPEPPPPPEDPEHATRTEQPQKDTSDDQAMDN
ncbi:XRE family transcriptional regulator [Rhodobacteraceae bacterium CCMM004]|nr:XRE family transcriptional regulator [Rhodobacteraceae bacterium CCMM004]